MRSSALLTTLIGEPLAPLAPTPEGVGVPTSDEVGASGLSIAWVYILKSELNGKLYVGSTSDIESRLEHHYGGFTPITKRLGRVKEVFRQEFSSLEKARRMEKKLKKLKRRDYLEKIIREGKIRTRD